MTLLTLTARRGGVGRHKKRLLMTPSIRGDKPLRQPEGERLTTGMMVSTLDSRGFMSYSNI